MQKSRWMRLAKGASGFGSLLACLLIYQNCGSFTSPASMSSSQSSTANSAGGGSSTTTVTTSGSTGPGSTTTSSSTTDVCIGSPSSTAPSTANLTPQTLRKFAGVDQLSICGEGQVVAVIISAQNTNIMGDLSTFSATYGLPLPTADNFQIVAVDGSCATAGTPLEAHIDVEMVHVMAPKAKIIMSCAGDTTIASRGRAIQAAITAGATIVSMSWGEPEVASDMSVLEPIFAANPTVTFFAGSGDSGANLDANGNPQVAYPAASKYVVAVGATADDGSNALTIWPKSGGGVSKLVARPSYQAALSASFGTGRLVPDIALNGAAATEVELYTPQGFTGAAGTSVASPLAAGMMALANQTRGSAIGDIHQKLYDTLATQTWSSYFRDVTSGNNGLYSALPGFDLVGGLGSPRGNLVVPYLAMP